MPDLTACAPFTALFLRSFHPCCLSSVKLSYLFKDHKITELAKPKNVHDGGGDLRCGTTWAPLCEAPYKHPRKARPTPKSLQVKSHTSPPAAHFGGGILIPMACWLKLFHFSFV